MIIVQTQLRLPEYIRDWVKKRGSGKSRSMNGEIVEILKEALAREGREKNKVDEK